MALNVTLRDAWLPRTTARVLPAIPWHGVLAIAAAIVDVAALLLTLAGAHAGACANAATMAPTPQACTGFLALPPFTPEAAFGLMAIVALGLLPAVTLRTRLRWPCALAAVGQVALQIAGVGLFLFWVPALILTALAAVI